MELNEAKKILNDNGYELLDEGKLGRALGIGALALGGLVGNANAIDQNDIDRFEKQTEMEIENRIYVDDDTWIEIVDLNNNELKLIREIKRNNYFKLEIIAKFSEKEMNRITDAIVENKKQSDSFSYGFDYIWSFRKYNVKAKELHYKNKNEIEEVIIYKNGCEVNRLKDN